MRWKFYFEKVSFWTSVYSYKYPCIVPVNVLYISAAAWEQEHYSSLWTSESELESVLVLDEPAEKDRDKSKWKGSNGRKDIKEKVINTMVNLLPPPLPQQTNKQTNKKPQKQQQNKNSHKQKTTTTSCNKSSFRWLTAICSIRGRFSSWPWQLQRLFLLIRRCGRSGIRSGCGIRCWIRCRFWLGIRCWIRCRFWLVTRYCGIT